MLIEYLYGDSYLKSMVRVYNISKAIKNIIVDVLSIFPVNGNQETTQESTYNKEIVS